MVYQMGNIENNYHHSIDDNRNICCGFIQGLVVIIHLSPATPSPSPTTYRNADQKTVEPFDSLANEIEALQRVLFVAQGRMWTAKDRNDIGIVCNYDVAVPRFEAGSRLEINFIAIDEGLGS